MNEKSKTIEEKNVIGEKSWQEERKNTSLQKPERQLLEEQELLEEALS